MRLQPDRPKQVDDAVALNVGTVRPLGVVRPLVVFRITVSSHPFFNGVRYPAQGPLASLSGVPAKYTPQRGLPYKAEDSLHVQAAPRCGGLVELQRGVRRPRLGCERHDGVALPAARIGPQIMIIR